MRKLDRRRTAAILVGLAVVAQLLLPLTVERDPARQSEFAWEMFSKGAPEQEFLIETATAERRISPGALLPIVRTYIDYTEVLPEYLCDRELNTTRVGVVSEGGTRWITCS
jgi:hypothetical protein